MAIITPFLIGYLVLAALMLGSFTNLAADRLPRHESILWPRSHCCSCGRVLNLVDLVPVVGYMARAGRCASCEIPIGLMSPVVEAVSGACMILSIAWLGLWPGAAVGLALVVLFGCLVIGAALRGKLARA